jgi:hypothetical protein
MQGLEIKPRWQPAIAAERRSFAAVFCPILPQLGALHWIYPDSIPILGGDADLAALVEHKCSEGYIPPGTLLPKYAHFVVNDWAELYGFRVAPNVPATREKLRGGRDYTWLSGVVDVCFFNVDGAWWEVYATDQALIQTVRQHILGLPDISIQERLLAQRDSLL